MGKQEHFCPVGGTGNCSEVQKNWEEAYSKMYVFMKDSESHLWVI